MLFSKIVKLLPLFFRDPTYVLFVPVSVVFGYLHALVKLYAASTLHVVSFLCMTALLLPLDTALIYFNENGVLILSFLLDRLG